MRGKIIHYNAADGRGLIRADNTQVPFEISQWRSDSAPAVNQTVELHGLGEQLQVSRVDETALLKEKAGELAERLGQAGGAGLQAIKDNAPAGGCPWLVRLGKPLLIAQGLFVIGALFFSYVTIDLPGASLGKSLVDLSALSGQLGTSVGGAFWAWVGILAFVVPLLWRSRLAWLALLLPLIATVLPMISLLRAAHQADMAMGNGMAASNGLLSMINPGLGAGLCAFSALFLAGLGVKRFFAPPRV